MRIDKNTTIRLGDRNIVKIKIGDSVIWQKSTEPVVGPDYFYIESLGDGNTISVKNKGNGNTDNVTPTLEYSTDKNTWNTITFDWASGTHTTELPVKLNTGDKMYFRNDTRKFSNSSSKYISFSSTVSSNVGGDIRTLSNYINVDNETKPQEYMFNRLFYDNKKIVDASNLRLPYTTLANNCYSAMFRNCSSLTTVPTLPATTLARYCYSGMFWGCTSLTSAPVLPATTLADYCYSAMFYGCTSLTTAPSLPATTLANNCYQSMFQSCNSLTTAPSLPAVNLASSCYQYMFQDCTKLTTALTLPAVNLASSCYYSMFQGCTSLTTAPSLPATTLANYCYQYMFQDCTSLVNAPSLPATTLASQCYMSMFNGCTKLTTAPSLPATTLANNCYQSMFNNCKSLNSITVYADDISAIDCTSSWLLGVASSGTFNNYGSAIYPTDSPSGIPSGWTVNSYGTDYFYVENTYAGENTITFTTTQSGTPASGTYATSVEYSKDKLTWNTINFDTLNPQTITLEQGEKLYLRNNSGYFNYTDDSNNYYTSITGSKSHKLGGNINTIINYTDLSNVSLSQGCFSRMFLNDIELVDASDLKLPSTTLTPHCYRAFLNNCQSLLYAPALPATTLANKCYYAMFYGDKSLISAPELPATTLAGGCYDSIFRDCTKLNSITVYANDVSAHSCTNNWLSGVASSGTFRNLGSATYKTNSASGIPSGWTEVKN